MVCNKTRLVSEAATLLGCPVLHRTVSSPRQRPLGSTSPRRTAGAAGGSVASQDTWTNNEQVSTPNTTTRFGSHSGMPPFTGGESGRTSFFLDFFFVPFSETLSLKPLMFSVCLFLAGLASVFAGNTSEVRFGVRGEFLLPTIKAPSFSPTASSITRTNSSRTGDERRSLFLEAAGGALMAEELFSRRLYRAAGFTSPVMLFFLRVK